MVPVLALLVVVISPSSNGREKIDANGNKKPMSMHRVEGAYPSFNGRGRMDSNGTRKHVPLQLNLGSPRFEIAVLVIQCYSNTTLALAQLLQDITQ